MERNSLHKLDQEVPIRHHLVYSTVQILEETEPLHCFYSVPSLELRSLRTFPERLFFVLSLIPTVSVFGPCSGVWMNTADAVLLGVAMLTTVPASTEGLEFEVSGC